MNDYEKAVEDLDEAIAAAEVALTGAGASDSDIAQRIEEAMAKLNQARDLAEKRA